ncbi:hypothetical protein [Bacillus sp. PS06]|uniref:hypothetical protein n=1 Tax=Bacillus sp. PS06 TaxID=2764176 RepID=UPI00177F8409|nr:hypothetical protein [Bacillus sp. PS06]MBD8068826.1 hypothetical protein [Bacillus sp. PS06]
MEALMIVAINIGTFFMPILCIIFCVNLVSILKKVKNDENTGTNTFWLTSSFTMIIWIITFIGIAGIY